MPEKNDGPWLVPPERAKTHAELRTSAPAVPSAPTMRIGEVADRLGLSLRSIRYYEESGLVAPSARTQGGFRLYTEPDVNRLLLIMQMKPLGFSLDEMRDVLLALDALDTLDEPGATEAQGGAENADGNAAAQKLGEVLTDVERRLETLRAQVGIAESFQQYLRTELTELTGQPASGVSSGDRDASGEG